MKSKIFLFTALLVFFCAALSVSFGNAQTRRTKTKTIKAKTTPTPSPQQNNAEIISLADQNDDENTTETTETQTTKPENTTETTEQENLSNTALNERIKLLESKKNSDYEEKQKRLLMNLDILSKAEQRSEILRKQLFEMMEKQNSIQARIEQINYDLRPEMIERYAAYTGSFRPELIREARRKTLENEKGNLESLLTQINNSRASLDLNVQKADLMVEKLRLKLEKEIDDALEENDQL